MQHAGLLRFTLLLCPLLWNTFGLVPVHRFRTAGAAGCAFDPASDLLACANFWDGASPNMEARSVLYRVVADGSGGVALQPQQRFKGSGAHGADFFSAGGAAFLVLPFYYGCGSDRGPAKPGCGSTAVYKRVGGRFVEHQRLATAGPSQTTHFTLPGTDTTWLLTGENFNDEVCVWELEAVSGLFEKRGGCLHVPGAGAMAVAVEGRGGWAGPTLLVAGSYFDNGWATQSRVFRFVAEAAGGRFEEVQRIDTLGAHGVALQPLGGELLLFFAEDRGASGPIVNSTLLRWEPASARFEVLQRLPTDGAHGARLLEVQVGGIGIPHCFVANFGDRLGSPPRYAARSALWRAAGPRGEPPWTLVAEVPSQGATDVTLLVVGGRTFLVLSNEGDLGRKTHQNSVVYRVDEEGVGGAEL